MKIITKIYLSIGFILLTFLFVTVMHRYQSEQVEQEIEDVLYITEKLKLSETLQKHTLDMETGLRGYLLSDRKSFLEPYYEGSQAFDVARRQLLQLEKDPEQRQRLRPRETRPYPFACKPPYMLIRMICPCEHLPNHSLRIVQNKRPYGKLGG